MNITTNGENCDSSTCQTYSTLKDLADTIQTELSQNKAASVCLCPYTYSNETGGCTGEDTLVVDENSQVELACAASAQGECVFECASTLLDVAGECIVVGSILVSGGMNQSRMIVRETGFLSLDEVIVME